MPRLTPEQRAEKQAELEALLRDDDDDDDDEFEVGGFSDGTYIRGKRRHVEAYAAARGHKLRLDPEPEGEEEDAKPKGGKVVQGRGFGKAPYGRRTG